MHESDTYLMILEEGEAKALREVVLLQGGDQFGAADEAVRSQRNGVTDLDRLKRMARKTPRAASWQDILETP
jgi:hypothetical protein